ncbi:hypothetical protein MRX96_006536 [Rhipicephalus microplus]
MHTTHIKMNSRGDGRGQADNSMTVTMEVNGIIYHGVLYPPDTQKQALLGCTLACINAGLFRRQPVETKHLQMKFALVAARGRIVALVALRGSRRLASAGCERLLPTLRRKRASQKATEPHLSAPRAGREFVAAAATTVKA